MQDDIVIISHKYEPFPHFCEKIVLLPIWHIALLKLLGESRAFPQFNLDLHVS